MHARELSQLAATIAANASLLIYHGEPFPTNAIELYWTASKCRQENWNRALKDFSTHKQDGRQLTTKVQCGIQPTLEEVLTAEVLSRVWAAACALADTQRKTNETVTVARNIMAAHLESRNRVLNLMVYGYGLRVEEAVSLNRLRIRNEHWTDLLLSLLHPVDPVIEWSFQPERVRRLAMSLRRQETAAGYNLARSLLIASFGAAYHPTSSEVGPSCELNRRIASSIIACFPPHAFDGTGQLTSVRQLWLLQSASDTQGHVTFAKSSISPQADDFGAFPPGKSNPPRRF